MTDARFKRSGSRVPSRAGGHGGAIIPHRRWAFTLVELLVVISIIALLISILLPSLKQAREQAKTVKCLAHSRGLGQAVQSFATDHKGRMQLSANRAEQLKVDPNYGTFAYGTEEDRGNRELLVWTTALAQASEINLVNNWDWGVRANESKGAGGAIEKKSEGKVPEQFELALCPSDRIGLATSYYPNGTSLVGSGDPQDPVPPATGKTRYYGLLSYAINEDIAGVDIDGRAAVWKDGKIGEVDPDAGTRLEGKLERIFDPASVILLLDAGPDTLDLAEVDPIKPNLLISATARGPYLGDTALGQFFNRFPKRRHPSGQLNVTFADGHGGAVKPVKFRTWPPGSREKRPYEFAPASRVSPYKVVGYIPPPDP